MCTTDDLTLEFWGANHEMDEIEIEAKAELELEVDGLFCWAGSRDGDRNGGGAEAGR